MRAALRVATRRSVAALAPIALRGATAGDAPAIHALVVAHLAEGHLLPRALDEIAAHADRFVLATDGETVLGCAELAPLSSTVAEVRSFVVSHSARHHGVGRRLVDSIVTQAHAGGFHKVCAFTHTPSYFVHLGFSIVPHSWLPEKIATDCRNCSLFGRCGQHAVSRTLHG